MNCSKQVWPDTFVEEGVLAVNVAALRKALNEGDEGRSYIETVPRRGYRFIGEVQALRRSPADEAAQGIKSGERSHRPGNGDSRRACWQ